MKNIRKAIAEADSFIESLTVEKSKSTIWESANER